MMRDEFDRNCNLEISDEDYKKVEFVYNFHPCNFDKVGIAKLVEEYGMVIIYDMLPRANAAMKLGSRIAELRVDITRAKEQLKEAMAVDMRSEDFISLEGEIWQE